MDSAQHSFDNYSLHQAAVRGDHEGVRRAIHSGADVNALDNTGRTVVACAVAGDNWENIDASDATFMSPSRLSLLSTIVGHPDISLYTLNAPQSAMRGVTPLGMAAWLNIPDAVKVLLQDSAEAVSVDGMDTHGATALMYAARDGSLLVVQTLLSHGARPDFRDVNHRTSIHYALPHPQILYLCEAVLRRHRWRESKSVNRLFSDSEQLLKLAAASLLPAGSFLPPPMVVFNSKATSRLTSTLVQAIQSSDLSFLYSILFPSPSSFPSPVHPISSPLLVNCPDAKGWSAIHHCVSATRPSVDVLDALYCAGSDVSLFTATEHYTPLHCLARSARAPDNENASALYQFTIHLIRDFRAPLSARDTDDETCIHIAAEHGESIDVLIAFLDCDPTGFVRKMRNSRGLTALEVARPEFCAAFGEDAEHFRPPSSLSARTIRPVASFSSVSSLVNRVPLGQDVTQSNDDASLVSSSDYDISTSCQLLLHNLRLTSPTLDHDCNPANLDYLGSVVRDTAHMGHDIIHHLRTHVEDAVSELCEAETICNAVCTLLRVVKRRVDARLDRQTLDAYSTRRRRNRESEDSQLTACEVKSNHTKNPSMSDLPAAGRDSGVRTYSDVSISTVPLLDVHQPIIKTISGTHAVLGSEIWKKAIPYAESKPDNANFLDMDEEVSSGLAVSTRTTKHKREVNLNLWTKHEPATDQRTATKAGQSGTAKFTAWLRKKIAPEPPLKLQILRDIDDTCCGVGREVKDRHSTFAKEAAIDPRTQPDIVIDTFFPRCRGILGVADRDLVCISQHAIVANQLIQAASQAISRAEQTIQKALEKRESAIAKLRCQHVLQSSGPAMPSEPRSSVIGSLPTKCDDEDTKALQRLLLRKIEARMVGAFGEIDKIAGWLQIVREVVRGVKRRTYL